MEGWAADALLNHFELLLVLCEQYDLRVDVSLCFPRSAPYAMAVSVTEFSRPTDSGAMCGIQLKLLDGAHILPAKHPDSTDQKPIRNRSDTRRDRAVCVAETTTTR